MTLREITSALALWMGIVLAFVSEAWDSWQVTAMACALILGGIWLAE